MDLVSVKTRLMKHTLLSLNSRILPNFKVSGMPIVLNKIFLKLLTFKTISNTKRKKVILFLAEVSKDFRSIKLSNKIHKIIVGRNNSKLIITQSSSYSMNKTWEVFYINIKLMYLHNFWLLEIWWIRLLINQSIMLYKIRDFKIIKYKMSMLSISL